MKGITVIATMLMLAVASTSASAIDSEKETVIYLNSIKVSSSKNTELSWRSANIVAANYIKWIKETSNIESTNKSLKWSIKSSSAIVIYSESLPHSQFKYLVESGDSISINNIDNQPIFTGKGAEKLKLIIEINKVYNGIQKPSNTLYYRTLSLEDHKEWNIYLNNLSNAISQKISSYKDKISPFAFKYIQADVAYHIEYRRWYKTSSLINGNNEYSKGLTSNNKCSIFDSTLNNSMARWLRNYPENIGQSLYLFFYNYEKFKRDLNYNQTTIDSLKKDGNIFKTMLTNGEKIYRDNAYMGFKTYLLTSEGIKHYYGKPDMEKLLSEYYANEKNKERLAFVKDKEYNTRRRYLQSGKEMPNFELIDAQGNRVTKSIIKNKVACISFEYPQETILKQTLILKNVKEKLKSDSNVIFIKVLVSPHQNELENDRAKEVHPYDIQLHTLEYGKFDPVIPTFCIQKSPSIYLIDAYGTILMTPWDSSNNQEELILRNIKKALIRASDGPYVVYEHGSTKAYYINGQQIDIVKVENKMALSAKTDIYNKSFTFSLKDTLQNEPSVYPETNKILVLSDIEGNFDAMRKLLQSNHVINDNMEWTFEKGHLVLCGDFFDRGQQVTECLWLIYALEEKAKRVGGYVHFILGNHEIMNLQGDKRYLHNKYKENAKLLNYPYEKLYSLSSELGKWLCTKNIIEKIGNNIFVHGGLSPKIIDLDITIEQINNTSRSYYCDSLVSKNKMPIVSNLFKATTSPFWFRGYYKNKKVSEIDIDNILEKYNASRIITGHTVVSNLITSHYNGKVINTDVQHAKGRSAALLIENGALYNVNMEGQRKSLESFSE